MGLEGIDLPAVGGGISILGIMAFILRLAFSRLDKQDTAWTDLLEASERRAEAAETTLAELRRTVIADRESTDAFRRQSLLEYALLKQQLEEAKLQILDLQKRDGDK